MINIYKISIDRSICLMYTQWSTTLFHLFFVRKIGQKIKISNDPSYTRSYFQNRQSFIIFPKPLKNGQKSSFKTKEQSQSHKSVRPLSVDHPKFNPLNSMPEREIVPNTSCEGYHAGLGKLWQENQVRICSSRKEGI